jgi:hypothetical protein
MTRTFDLVNGFTPGQCIVLPPSFTLCMITLMNGVIHVTSQFPLDAAPLRHAVIFVGRGFTQHCPVVHGALPAAREKLMLIVFILSSRLVYLVANK